MALCGLISSVMFGSVQLSAIGKKNGKLTNEGRCHMNNPLTIRVHDRELLDKIKHVIAEHRKEHPIPVDIEHVVQEWEQVYAQQSEHQSEHQFEQQPERLVPIDQYEEDCYNGVGVRQRIKNRLARKRMQAGTELYVGIALCPSISTKIGLAVYHRSEGRLEYSAHTFWSIVARLEKLRTVFGTTEVLIYGTSTMEIRDIELLSEWSKAVGFRFTIVPPMKKQWTDWEFRLHTKNTGRKVPQCVRDATRAIWWRWL